MGSPCRFIRQRLEQTTSAVRELASSTRRLESGRIQPQLEGARRLLFPTVQPYSVLPVQTVGGRSRSDHHHSLLAESALVPVSDGPHNRLPSSAPSVFRPLDFTYGRESPSGPEQFDPVNRMETLRRGLQTQGLSDEAIDLVLSATRKNTRAAYQSAWNSWRDWCSSKHKDPLSAGVSDVLNFLADVHKSGIKSYRTVNIARSMLSSTLNLKPGNLLNVGRESH